MEAEEDTFHLEKIPVFEIQTPEYLVVNVEYTISFKYALPNGCYSFYGKEYNVINENTREITALAEVSDNMVCTQEYTEEVYSFSFKPTESKTYLFKFWIGLDRFGNDKYEEVELIVE